MNRKLLFSICRFLLKMLIIKFNGFISYYKFAKYGKMHKTSKLFASNSFFYGLKAEWNRTSYMYRFSTFEYLRTFILNRLFPGRNTLTTCIK